MSTDSIRIYDLETAVESMGSVIDEHEEHLDRVYAAYHAVVAERDAALRRAEEGEAVVEAAVEWNAALDACGRVGYGPIGSEDDPVWQKMQAEHTRLHSTCHQRFDRAYVALERAVKALVATAPPAGEATGQAEGDSK